MRYEDSVSCTSAVLASSRRPTAGMDGMYMSVDSGPNAVSNPSRSVNPMVLGRNMARLALLHDEVADERATGAAGHRVRLQEDRRRAAGDGNHNTKHRDPHTYPAVVRAIK